MKKNTLYLSLIVLASCLIKFFVLWLLIHVNAGFTQPDSASYLRPAKNMLSGGSFWLDPSLWMRTPGYPLFLAAIFKVTGVYFIAVVLVQLALSGFLVINAYRIGKILGNSTIGLWAAVVVAGDYLFASFFALILTDLLFAVIFSFIFYYLIVFMQDHEKRFRAALIIGMWLAISTWIRPIPYYLTPLLSIALILYSWRTAQFPKALVWVFLLVIPSVILIGAWQIRNKEVIGTYQYTGIDAVNFYHYYAADIIAHQQHITITDAQQQLEAKASSYHLEGLARNSYYRHEGLNILFDHPVSSARQVIRGFFRMLFGSDYSLLYYSDQQWQYGKQLEFDLKHLHLHSFAHKANWSEYVRLLFTGFFHVFNVFLIISTVYFLGVSLASVPNRSAVIACLIVLAYFCLVSSNTCSNARFRLPFQLILDCFAVLGVFSFLRRYKVID